jgi:hypothetical protein
MRTKIVIGIAVVLPVMLSACNRQTPSSSSVASEDRQATAPASPGRTLENAPPAAGTPPDGAAPSAVPMEAPVTAPAGDAATGQLDAPTQDK